MADIKLTTAQRAVVENRGGALLVSAAAGSGKTKVLVDRLLSRICDPINPCNLDDFLVITYTKAAAAELRVKIAQAISQRIAQEPHNRHLQRQLNRIYLAEISTVHSFCSNLLRTYAHKLDIPADFRVAEETESRVLQDKVLNELLEIGYAEQDPEFQMMVETFGYGRDDRRLPEAIKMAHREMRCRANMTQWMDRNLRALDIGQYVDASETPWGSYLMEAFRAFLTYQIEKFHRALDEMGRYPNIEKGLRKTFEANMKQMEDLLACSSWDAIYENKISSFGRAVVRNPEDASVKERIAKVRTMCWSELKVWQEQFFGDSQSILQDLEAVAPGAQALLRFTAKFDQAYGAEKKRRKLMDFSDLEHEAIRLLTDRYTGKPTQTAKEVSERFVEILVDEYQDSNQVQDTIFEAVSRNGCNRFMVGDVKQSIYRFRLADPSLFLNKYEEYPDYQYAEENAPRRILLSENFRSRPEILSACNDVFRLIMRKNVGDLDYGEEEALKPGRSFPVMEGGRPVELHCLTSSDPTVSQDKTDLEAEYVAKRIFQMLCDQAPVTSEDGTRPVRPGDIVILMRSVSATAGVYLEALGRYGIPAVCDRGGSLLDTSEVQILVALLQVIDNPHQDVPLLTTLASPVFGFTPDQLAQPRVGNRKEDYFDTLCGNGGVFQPFLDLLQELRQALHWMDLLSFLDLVLRKTKMLSIFAAMPDGPRRERNLTAFRSFVASFSANGNKSLPQLLWHLADLQENHGQIPMPKTAAENAVSIMTIHSSKGLEFPVVFLCDLSRKFNMRDMQDAILVDDVLSVGCNRVDHQKFVRYPTMAKKAIIHKKTREAVSEELRVLYVAMTRAKDRLIMTYYSKSLLSELNNINSQLTMPLSDDLCGSARSPGKWILMAALCRTEAGALLNLVEGNDVSEVREHPWDIRFADLLAVQQEMDDPVIRNTKTEPLDEDCLSLVQYQYPHLATGAVPAKLTATQLKGRLVDQEAADGAGETDHKISRKFRRASFRFQTMTAAEKGTATHLFMQFADYRQCVDRDLLKKELNRLCFLSFLTAEQAACVQTEQILQFFHSELGRWLLAQKNVRREFKFSVLIDPKAYYPNVEGEKSMLQGVVDCFVTESDGITILDFKTDRVGDDARARAETYRSQLDAYAASLSRIYQLPIKQRILYFFSAGQAIIL